MAGDNEVSQGVEGYPSTLVGGVTTAEELLQLQKQNPTAYHAAMNAVNHDTQRRIVWALVQNDGRVSYEQLEHLLEVSDRTKRKHVSRLEGNNLIERVDSNFTVVSFADQTVEVLVRHALTTWYDSTA